VNHHATGAKPPTQVITIDDLDREIDALRAQLDALVALKRSLTMLTPGL
jgi:hypothetical protein